MDPLARFPRRHPVRLAHIGLSALLHGACLLMASQALDSGKAFSQSAYIPPLIGLGFGLSLALALLPASIEIRFGALGLKLLGLFLVLTPTGFPSPLKAALVSAFVIEAFLSLSSPADAVAAALSIALVLITQGERKVWDATVPGARLEELAGLLLFPLMGGILAWGFKSAAATLRDTRAEARRIQEGIQRIIMANVSFQELAQETEEASSERERKRISREIHDVVGYTLTNQHMALEAALLLFDQEAQRERVRELLETAQDQSKEGLREVRAALHALRGETPRTFDFPGRLAHICLTFQKATGVKVDYDAPIRQHEIPLPIELVIYRIVQAGLTNSFLHGGASAVKVTLQTQGGTAHLAIQDNGTGAGEISEGIGLSGMRERILPFGGSLSYLNTECGFLVAADIPLPVQEP